MNKSNCAVVLAASFLASGVNFAVVSPSMAGDLKEEIVAAEKAGWKAYADHDAKAYGDYWTEDGVEAAASGGVLNSRQEILADLSSTTCKVKSFDLADTKVRQLSPDVALLTYNLTQDVTCGKDKLPPKAFVTSVYVRQGPRWRCASYQETAQP
jgi:uncharacterized protein (TIGR02246 family)